MLSNQHAGSRYPVRGEPARLRFMRLLILGAGAVGGYFGGRLAEAGADVTFLVRPARKAQLESQGLRLTSPFGDVTLPVRARLASEVDGDQDLVLLACKAYDLTAAMDAIAPAMSGRAGVLPFLNGVSHVATLEQRFGRGRVLGGTARIVASMAPDGVIQHLTKLSALAFGELDGTVSPRTLALLAACGRTSFESRISTDIRRDLWLKLTFLGTLAAMNSLMRASVGEIVRAPEGAALFARLFETNAEICRREGHAPDEAYLANYRKLFAQTDSTLEASLLRDLESGGPIEADHLLGFLLERCRAHGLDDTLHATTYAAAKAYEQRRAAGRIRCA